MGTRKRNWLRVSGVAAVIAAPAAVAVRPAAGAACNVAAYDPVKGSNYVDGSADGACGPSEGELHLHTVVAFAISSGFHAGATDDTYVFNTFYVSGTARYYCSSTTTNSWKTQGDLAVANGGTVTEFDGPVHSSIQSYKCS